MAPNWPDRAEKSTHPSADEPGSDQELVLRVRAGDQAAFQTLFQTYHGPLCAFVYHYLGARDLAEEIVQDVFLFVWERREAWDVKTSVKNYLFTAARNGALSYLRHERVIERHAPEAIELLSSPAPRPDRELNARELGAAVSRAVSQLPPRCRLIFSLHRQQQLTYSEIAEVLELSPKTVEVQMGRALKALRKSLEAFWS